jgi:hypothetical protein
VKLAALALTALFATGCMGRSTSSGSGQAQTAIPAKTYLRISVWPKGKSRAHHLYQLWCRGPGGEISPGIAKPISAPRACERAVKLWPHGFKPVPDRAACTMVYGGPAVAEVEGLIGGRAVKAQFERRDGCEIHRWDGLRFLFPGVR